MHEHELNQISSKRYGVRIEDSQLPRDYDRRILVNSNGCCTVPYLSKRAEEVLDYFIDMMKWLEPNEEVIGIAAWTRPDTLVTTRVEYASTGAVIWLAGGGDDVRQTVYAQISTSLGKIKLVEFILHTCGIAGALTIITGEGGTVYVGDDDIDPNVDYAPIIKAYPAELSFPVTGSISGQSSKTIILKNDGNADGFIRRIDVDGPFSQRNAGVQRIVPGEFVQLTVMYKPQSIGEHVGSLSIDVGEDDDLIVTLTGNAISANRVTTNGNQLVLTDGATFRLKSINWFGAETEVFAPHGLWLRNYKELIDQIKAMGFNSVRLPFSGDICNNERLPQTGVINTELNGDLIDLTAIQVLDKVISYINEVGLYVVLDHHRRNAGDGADGSPIDATYSLLDWKASWAFMVGRYAHLDYVLGADLHNEPHDLSWNTWADLAENAGNHILKLAPHWLIFVEGVESYGDNTYWWGGELSGVADRPIELDVDGRLVYSVHEYGQSVSGQPWLAKDGAIPDKWPLNLYSVWRKHWGFIFEQGIAPVWIGEVGGKFGVDGNGEISNTYSAQYERQWIYHLQRYMKGHFTGSNDNPLAATDQGISFAYWSLNPNSGDTGGILQDDWSTEQSFKLELISMMLSNSDAPYIHGLTPLPWDGFDDQAQIIINKDGADYAVTIGALTDAFNDMTLAIGLVHFFASNINPNDLYVGQSWLLVPGAEKTIRLAKADGSNVLAEGGSDTITLEKANLPNIQINVTGTISNTDLGSKTTNTTGSHTHSVLAPTFITETGGLQGGNLMPKNTNTSSSGDHSHTVDLGTHGHNLTGAKTAALGSGTSITIVNQYVTLAAWYRES